jgi:SAM-dependent methyltransferase
VTVDADAFNAFEAAGWEERAGGYHRFFGPVTSRVIDPLLDSAEVGPGTRVLDVASGPGYVAAACAARGATVVGLDIAHEMVALAGQLHPGIEFRQGDVERLPFDDGSFEAVVGNFLILHLGRPEQAAAELARVVAPGGRLALSAWDLPEHARLFGVVLDAIAEAGAAAPSDVPAGPPFFRFSEDAEFARLLASVGLIDVLVRTISFTHRLSSADDLWDGLLGGTVRTRVLVLGQPEEIQGRIRAAFDRIVSEYAVGGGLELPVAVKLASGRKPDSVWRGSRGAGQAALAPGPLVAHSSRSYQCVWRSASATFGSV